jgi:peroxiredoxin
VRIEMNVRRAVLDLLTLTGLERRPNMLKVGDPAPEFTARTDEGKEVRLSDYRGRRVILWFYPKADTPG